MPDPKRDKRGADGWNRRLLRMRNDGCITISRRLKYNVGVGREKGIDVRIMLDLMRLTLDRHMDVALVFSQDNDFAEVAREIHALNRKQGHFIRIASAYPFSTRTVNRRGINHTMWVQFNRTDWDSCLY